MHMKRYTQVQALQKQKANIVCHQCCCVSHQDNTSKSRAQVLCFTHQAAAAIMMIPQKNKQQRLIDKSHFSGIPHDTLFL